MSFKNDKKIICLKKVYFSIKYCVLLKTKASSQYRSEGRKNSQNWATLHSAGSGGVAATSELNLV